LEDLKDLSSILVFFFLEMFFIGDGKNKVHIPNFAETRAKKLGRKQMW